MKLREIRETPPVAVIILDNGCRLEYSLVSQARKMAEIFRGLGYELNLKGGNGE